MNRPSADELLKPLKPFQRRTVEHAFHRLFIAKDSTARFLVADEVGLGKTLVARGIIARAIDHLWDDVERIDVIYICSNSSIARANLPKLQVSGAGDQAFALATRLTMLATELAPREGEPGLADNKLNFVSFTPGTSFNMGHSSGQRREREVLFHLLVLCLPQRRTALMNLLQGRIARKDDWRWGLNNNAMPLDPEITRRFHIAFRGQAELRRELHELFDTWFHYYRPTWPDEVRWRRDEAIAKLRQLLAEVCVQALDPDLVILDEFQRFKTLLETREGHRDPAAELARELFRSKNSDGNPVRTLLLSATPYKLYTADAEIGNEDHYEDFLATTRFLLDEDEASVAKVKCQLSRFGDALKRAAAGESAQVQTIKTAKGEVEAALRAIMTRTERVTASDERDAMVVERKPTSQLMPADVRQYLAADALFRKVGDRDPMALWKSAPYLPHFMHGYKFNERLVETSPDIVSEVLRQHASAFLGAEELLEWSKLDPGNAKLRSMVHDLLDAGLWRLLWIPPTVPYWPLEGPFEGKETITKTLLFSAWNVVPDVVSAVLSYEAERRMVGGRIESYLEPAKQQRPLLRLTQPANGKRPRRRLLLLLLPCLPLADLAHPLEAPAGRDRRCWVREQIKRLLAGPQLPNPRNGEIDERWEWAAPLLLDPALRTFLQAWKDGELPARENDEPFPKPNPDIFGSYVDDLLELQPCQLGRRPPGLVDLLTEVALGSPAILALRCLKASKGVGDDTRRELATRIADAFWSLFNQPAVISLIRQLATETGASSKKSIYWRLVLRYCRDGNLQAVLDEQWHLLWEQHAWSDDTNAEEIAAECAKELMQSVQPTRSRVHARFFRTRNRNADGPEEIRIRTVFALRFGHLHTEDGQPISQDAVRAAFNSPFRPFVLTSTSIGQEGLDFHPWCHRLVHWNLPGSPVDLEQREGRIHRYKGHAVRRNVVAAQRESALAAWQPGDDVWELLFRLAEDAARAAGETTGLVPHWIASGEHRVERHVPLLPYTAEVDAIKRLKRQLAAYRVAFGQPRQEELITLLDHAGLHVNQLEDWAIDLRPLPARR